MKTITLLPHESRAAAQATLRAVWRPVKIDWQHRPNLLGHDEWRIKNATVWSNGVWHTWDADGVGGENSAEPTIEVAKDVAFRSAVSQGFIPCPYGQRGDVVRLSFRDLESRGDTEEWVRIETRRTITSVDVRRAAHITTALAADWGLRGNGDYVGVWVEPQQPFAAVDHANEIWTARYGQAEWAWCVGLEEAR